MIEPKINYNKVIICEPDYSFCGFIVKNNKHYNFLKIFSTISIICGTIGLLGFISLISIFYFNLM